MSKSTLCSLLAAVAAVAVTNRNGLLEPMHRRYQLRQVQGSIATIKASQATGMAHPMVVLDRVQDDWGNSLVRKKAVLYGLPKQRKLQKQAGSSDTAAGQEAEPFNKPAADVRNGTADSKPRLLLVAQRVHLLQTVMSQMPSFPWQQPRLARQSLQRQLRRTGAASALTAKNHRQEGLPPQQSATRGTNCSL